mgnify:CR=1 FL=1
MSGKFLSTLKKAATVAGDVLTTKGDILSRSASALGRLGIGTNDQILVADSTQVLGLKWSSPATGYTQPTLGSTVIPSNTTVTTVNALILTASPNITLAKESKTLDSSGDFVYGYRNVLLDTYGGASTDDCNGATANVGICDEVMIQTEVSTRDVTIKDAVAASGTNFQGAGDFTLDLDADVWYGIANLGVSSFAEISRSNNV